MKKGASRVLSIVFCIILILCDNNLSYAIESQINEVNNSIEAEIDSALFEEDKVDSYEYYSEDNENTQYYIKEKNFVSDDVNAESLYEQGSDSGMELIAIEDNETSVSSSRLYSTNSYAEWNIDENGHLKIWGEGDIERDSWPMPWTQNEELRSKIITAEVNVVGMKDASYLFARCYNLKHVDLTNFDTSSVTDMSNMFANCSSLESIDLSNFNSANVTKMYGMFCGCSALKSIELKYLDMTNVTDINGFISGCSSLKSIDLQSLNSASHLVNIDYMFSGCSSLEEIDVSCINTTNVKNMNGVFKECSNLKDIDISNWDLTNTIYMAEMFLGCTNMKKVKFPFSDMSKVQTMNGMFDACSSLEELDLSNFDTSNVTSMSGMFNNCESLHYLDLSGFDTSNVTSMSSMFSNCSSIEYLDIGDFNTKKVTSMDYMFSGCKSLVDISFGENFDTSNVGEGIYYDSVNPAGMRSMFDGCESLDHLDLSGFNTENVQTMLDMFKNCKSLTELDLSSFDLSGINSDSPYNDRNGIARMFYGCSSLTELDLSSFEITSKFHCVDSFFEGCNSLKRVNIQNFNLDYGNKYSSKDFFKECKSLEEIVIPYNLRSTIILPTSENDKWYDNNGNVIEKIPQNTKQIYSICKNKMAEYLPASLDELAYLAMSDMVYMNIDEKGIIGEEICGNTIDNLNNKDRAQKRDGVIWYDVYKQVFGDPESYGWKIVDTSASSEFKNEFAKTGFYACLFVNDKTNQAVIAFRGSQNILDGGEGDKDWEDDFRYQLCNEYTNQMYAAVCYTNYCINKYSGYEFHATGHSLGGGLALLASISFDINAVPFDASATLDVAYYHNMVKNFAGVDKWKYIDNSCNEDRLVGMYDKNKNFYSYYSNFPTTLENLFNHHKREAIISYDENIGKYTMNPIFDKNIYTTNRIYSRVVKRWVNDTTLSRAISYYRNFAQKSNYSTSEKISNLFQANTINPLSWIGAIIPKGSLILGTSQDDSVSASDIISYTQVVYAGDGDDNIDTGNGDDYLHGNRGNDFLCGGEGDDTYFYEVDEWVKDKQYGIDTIFDITGKDKLVLTGIDDLSAVTIRENDSYYDVCYNDDAIIHVCGVRMNHSSFEFVLQGTNGEQKCLQKSALEAKDIVKIVKFACPVNLEVINADGITVFSLSDSSLVPVINQYGYFNVFYNEETGEYEKNVILFDDSYRVIAKGYDNGIMSFTTKVVASDAGRNYVYTEDNIEVEEGDIFNVVDHALEESDYSLDESVQLVCTSLNGNNEKIELKNETLVSTKSVIVEADNSNIMVGDKVTFSAVVFPQDSSYGNVTWYSLNPLIATIDENSGVCVANRAGTVTIQAITEDGVIGELSIEISGQIDAPFTDCLEGEIEKGSIIRLSSYNDAAKILYTIDGSDPLTKGIEYISPIRIETSSTIKAICVVNENAYSSIATFSYVVMDNVPKVINNSMILSVGEIYEIPINSLPEGKTSNDIQWSSNNTDVIEVDAFGVAHAKKKGIAEIEAIININGRDERNICKVTVTNSKVCTIYFDFGDISESVSERRVEQYRAVGKLPYYEDDMVYLAGWEDESGTLVDEKYSVQNNLTLFARYSDKIHINYFNEEGNLLSRLAYKPGRIGYLPGFYFEGHILDGWYDENNVKYDCNSVLERDINLFTKYQKQYYYVSFHECENINPIPVEYGNKLRLPEAFRQGYEFKGWYSKPSGYGERIDDEIEVHNNIVVYAYWEKEPEETYSVTFDSQGGTAVESIEGISQGDSITLPVEPTKEGMCVFCGWYTQPNGDGLRLTEATEIYSNLTVYAFWLSDGVAVSGLNGEYEYTGSQIKPEIEVYESGILLTLGKDYTLSYKNNINVADKNSAKAPTIVINGKGSFTKSISKTFSIIPKPIGEGSDFATGFNVTIADKQYTGKALLSKPQIKFGKLLLKEKKDYTLSYATDNPINPGVVTVTVTGMGNYSGTATVSYRIYDKGLDFSKISVAPIAGKIYTGSEIELSEDDLKVYKDSKKTVLLVKADDENPNGDYVVEYQNNVNAGTATAIIKPNVNNETFGGYGNSKKITFKITAKAINSTKEVTPHTVDIAIADGNEYTGSALKPAITVKDHDTGEIIDAANYSVSYANNINVAAIDSIKAPTVNVSFKKNYSGKASAKFAIDAKTLNEQDVTASIANVKNTTGKQLTVKDIKPTVKLNKKTLANNKDYIIDFAYDETKTMQTATIYFIGNYSGSISKRFKVYSVVGNIADTTIYTVDINAGQTFSYDGSKKTPEITVKEVVDGTTITLVQGTDYNLTYSNNVKAALSTSGKSAPTWKVTGKGAYKGTVSGTFDIAQAELNCNDFSIVVSDIKYTGKECKPKFTVKNNSTGKVLKSGTDYTFVYENNTAKGEIGFVNSPRVIITGKGNYKNPADISECVIGEFRIYEKDISSMTFGKIANVTYTGKQIKPDDLVVYADKKKTISLEEGVDYELTYGDNVKVGSGSVTVTGKGVYGGSKSVKFTILPKWLAWLAVFIN